MTLSGGAGRAIFLDVMTAAAELKRWVANHQAVDSHVRRERRLLTPAASLRKALQVSKLQSQLSGPASSTSMEEALQVHRVWVKLRSALLIDHCF